MKLSELRGKSVVSVTEAIKLGSVSDALVDSALGAIGALEVAGSGRNDRYLVSMGEVRAIGPDVVTVSGQHALTNRGGGDEGSRVALSSILGCRVVAENGTLLGTVSEVDFDPSAGRIEAIEYGGDGLGALLGNRHKLDPGNVIGVGPKVLTVRNPSGQPSGSEENAA